MFNINNITRTAATLALSAFALVSCLEIDDQQSGALGYLEAPELDVDVTVEDLTQTKTLDFEVVAPELSAVRFVVKDKDGNVKYDGHGLWTEPLVLPVGAYTVEATAGVNGFGAPYFTGSASGSISPLENEVPQLKLALFNSLVYVTVEESFTDHFKAEKVVLNNGEFEAAFGEWFYVPSGADLSLLLVGKNSAGIPAEFAYTLAAPSKEVAYRVTCGQKTTDWPSISLSLNDEEAWASRIYITTPASFSGNISPKNKASVVYEAIPSTSSDWTSAESAVTENGVLVIKDLTPGTEYQVRARVGALISNVVKVTPALDGFSATASHTYSDGELDGTDVTSTFSKPDVVKNSIASWSINLCKSDGTKLRSDLPLGTSVGAAITATNGWPYLPAGSYKLVAQATMKDGEVVENIISDSFSTDAPSFTVTASGYTTYDKYLEYVKGNANALAEANKEGYAEYIFQISATVGISENLLKNTNYGTTKIYYSCGPYVDYERDFVNGEGDIDGSIKKNNIGDVGGFSWGANALTAKVNFAGTVKTSSARTCHITGLPYSVSFSGLTSSPAGWSTSGSVSWSGYGWNAGDGADYLRLRGADSYSDRGKILSPAFSIPDNSEIDVTSIVDCYYYASSGQKQKIYVNSNTASCSEITSNATDIKNGTTFNNFNAIGDVTNTMILSNSKPHISITHNVPKEGAATRFMGIKSCVIKYM